jgi:hypothetical protein
MMFQTLASTDIMARRAKTSRMTKERLQKEYRAAIAEYDFLTNYLNASNALTKPEREFLEEFVNLAKRKSDRLRKVVPPRRR